MCFIDSFKLVLHVPTNLCHRSAAHSTVGSLLQKAVYTVKMFLKMGETVARNMWNKLRRINKTFCFIFLAADITVLVMHRHTNVKFVKIYIYKILPVVLYGCETWLL